MMINFYRHFGRQHFLTLSLLQNLLFAEVLLFFWSEFSFIPKLRAYSQFTS